MPDISGLVSAVQIEEVLLAHGSFNRPAGDLAEASFDVEMGYRTELLKVEGPSFAALIKFKLELMRRDDSDAGPETGKAEVTLHAHFMLKYSTPMANAQFDAGVLEEFARTNGVFNAWPFWREFVHSTFSRMALPTFTVPVFRLTKTAPTPKKRTRKHASVNATD